jgi:hypothetical protein
MLPRPVLPALHPDVHDKSNLDLLLNVVFGPRPEVLSVEPARRQFNNTIRLMDKTVIEYESAKDRCADWLRSLAGSGMPHFAAYYRAIDHMENCIGALHRTLLHLARIRQMPAAFPVDRTAHRALRAAIGEINDLRDAIEHADERLSMAEEGAPLPVPLLKDDRLTIGADSVAYVNLARWIHQTFRLVRLLLGEAPKGTAA